MQFANYVRTAPFYRCLVALVSLATMAVSTDVRGGSDYGENVLQLAFRSIQQTELTAAALGLALVSGASNEFVVDSVIKICDETEKSTWAIAEPVFADYALSAQLSEEDFDCVKALHAYQNAAIESIKAVKKAAEAGASKESVAALVGVFGKCDEAKKAALPHLRVVAERLEARQARVEEPGPGRAALGVAGKAAECPLGWDELLQMTGEEGPTARYKRNPDGKLRRVEALYRGSMVVAVTEVPDGFRVTIGNDIAVADFTSRPWFTEVETDGLVELYSNYITRDPNARKERVIGRFLVSMEPDPDVPIRPSFVLKGAK